MFTGKAMYPTDITLPETAEDVSELVSILVPCDAPFLNALGDPLRSARSICHKWTEGDELRCHNYTQELIAEIELETKDVKDSRVRLEEEMNYQKALKLKDLICDLENAVINGGLCIKHKTTRPVMVGIIPQLITNVFDERDAVSPEGYYLNKEKIKKTLQFIQENNKGSGKVDMFVVGEFQKEQIRKMKGICHLDANTFYLEIDNNLYKVVTSQWMPPDAMLLLDHSKVKVLPLQGKSFHFKPLKLTTNCACGEVVGEYTVELKHESAHGLITGLGI